MEFQVPQFVERQGKILGPLTFNQFIILFFLALLLWALSRIIPFTSVIILGVFIAVIAFWFIFGKIEGRPVVEMLQNIVGFTFGSSKFYIWQKTPCSQKIIEKQEFKKETKEEYPSKILGERKLEKLSSEIELRR